MSVPATPVLDSLSPERRALVLKRLREKQQDGSAKRSRIPRLERRERFPLSIAQEPLFVMHQLQPESVAFNIAQTVRLEGELRLDELASSLQAVVARHEALRITVRASGSEPRQLLDGGRSVALETVDGGSLPQGFGERAARALIRREIRRPFDLGVGPLFRLLVVRLARRYHLAAFIFHHIVADEWSIQLLIRELATFYEAFRRRRPPALPELEVQYGDYAAWQRRQMAEGVLERHLAFWRETLAGEVPNLRLPADRPRPRRTVFRSRRLGFVVPENVSAAVRRLSLQRGVTVFMALLAAFKTLLHRYCGATDLWVGSVVGNRNRKELQGLVGFFVNTVVLRTGLAGDPAFSTALERVSKGALAAFAHQDVPLERVAREIAGRGAGDRPRLYQTMFVLLNNPSQGVDLPRAKLRLEAFDLGGELQTLEDVNLYVNENSSAMAGEVEYNADIFDPSTMERLARHLQTLLRAAAADPSTVLSELALLTAAERQQLVEWNATAVAPRRPSLLHQLFERQADRRPDGVALAHRDEWLTYAEIELRANRLAHRLRELGVGPETRVGLCLERSPAMMASVLGILKAGGAYVPLDADYPRDRLAQVVESAVPAALVTVRALLERLPTVECPLVLDDDESLRFAGAGVSVERPAVTIDPANPVYVIYTSGSTGRPKGIPLSHSVLVNLIAWHLETLPPWHRMLQFSSLNFDVSVHEIFATWAVGALLEVAPEALRRSAPALAVHLRERRVDKVILPVVVFQQLGELLRESDELPRTLNEVTTTGEQLQVTGPTRQLLARLPHTALHNHYGPAETHVVTASTLPSGDPRAWPAHPPIGRPVHGARIHLADRQLREVPVGVESEVFIGGVCLARGYLDRPGLSAERFLPDPRSGEPGGRLYRTGDLARYRGDGEIEYLGRIDHQVKIRGFRIELEEIESALEAHPQVLETVVLAREDRAGDRRLVAYVVPEAGTTPTTTELARHLGEKLPPYMVPAVFVCLPALPLNPNGKIDRRALPAPGRSRPELETPYAAPESETERQLTEIWGQVLGIDQVGVDDHFIELGGDSVLSLQIAIAARRHGLAFDVREVMEHPTPRRLAGICRREEAPVVVPAAPPARDPGSRPLTSLQEGILFHTLYDRSGASYLESVECELSAPLDTGALREAWQRVVARHPILRTGFVWDAAQGPRQIVQDHVEAPLEEHDLRPQAPADRDRSLERVLDSRRPFDTASPPLLRLVLLRWSDEVYRMVWSYHHLIVDGWSSAVVLEEVEQVYRALSRGETIELEPSLPFGAYVDWLHRQDSGPPREHWRRYLAGFTGPTRLATELGAAAVSEGSGADTVRRLAPAVAAALRQTARRRHLTLSTLIHGAWAVLLGRYLGTDDVVFGTIVSGRPPQLRGVESMVGVTIANLPLRLRIEDGAAPGEWLAKLQENHREIERHAHFPLVEIQRTSELARDQRLFDHFLVVENFPPPPGEWSRRDHPALDTGYPFYLLVDPGEEIALRAVFDTRAFETTAVYRTMRHLETLLASLADQANQTLGALRLLTAPEEHQLLADWNDTAVSMPQETFNARFAAQVERHGDEPAASYRGRRLSYRELDRDAGRMASELAAKGVGPGTIVALLAERSLDFLTAILAILRAGGAYLPLDPDHPRRRHLQIVEQSGARLMLVRGSMWDVSRTAGLPEGLVVETLEEALAAEPATTEPPRGGPRELAYVIYTSGSTGVPKGAMVEQRGMLNHLDVKILDLGLEGGDVVVQNASQCFDISVWQFLAALLAGGRVHVVGDGVALDPGRLLDEVAAEGVTHLEVVPSLLVYFLEEIRLRPRRPELARLRLLIATGEALAPELCRRWLGFYPHVALLNAYGPTECSDDVTHFTVSHPPAERTVHVPVGRPLSNLRLYLLDRRLREVPVGVLGELQVGGVGVGRGYLDEPRRTAEVFVPDRFSETPGERAYRTGDLGRLLPDGHVEFRGRLDHQVKIRGFRIELGEIEAVLAAAPGIREAAVLVHGAGSAEPRLAAWVAGDSASATDPASLSAFLGVRLPDYMVPASFTALDALPKTTSGKVDRRRLPDPENRNRASDAAAPPMTPRQRQVAEVWRQVLGLARVRLDDNFFELGGDSLTGVRLVLRLREELGLALPVVTLFEHATVRRLVEAMEEEGESEHGESRIERGQRRREQSRQRRLARAKSRKDRRTRR